ncbi:hypothetical protein ACP70R_045510 [Stipagrostis hirtigluma subsp. patula]
MATTPEPVELAAAGYGVLPADVLFDVLLRLPADELCRLRLVCRSWRSLTSDPLFAKAHSSRHPHIVALHTKSSEVHVIDLFAGDVLKRMRLDKKGCDGLSTQLDAVCVSHGWGQAYVLDVVTGAVVADVTAEHRRKLNSSKPTTMLGYIPSTGEYKVLRLQSAPSPMCEVTTLGGVGKGRWRRIRQRPPVSMISSSSRHMAVIGGIAYFMVIPDFAIHEPDSIASFDLAMEKWRPTTIRRPLSSLLLTSPDGGDDDESPMHYVSWLHFRLATLNGYLVTVHYNYQQCSMDLWFLEDVNKSHWTKRYSVRYELLPENFPQDHDDKHDDDDGHLWEEFYEEDDGYSSVGFSMVDGERFWEEFTQYHPLVVLDDGRIIFLLDKIFCGKAVCDTPGVTNAFAQHQHA